MFDLIAPFFNELHTTTGFNFVTFYDKFAYEKMVEGMWVTVKLAVASLSLSLVMGVLGAWAQESSAKALRTAAAVYVHAFRNTPPFVQLLFFYFALGQFTPEVDAGGYMEPAIGAFGWAAIALGLFGGAFNVEIFRAGLGAIPESLREAGEALGYSRTAAFLEITLPLAFRFSLPALSGNLISLLKTTSLAYVIAVPEMTQVAYRTWADHFNVVEMMIVLFVFYNVLVSALAIAMRALERASRIPGYGK